MRPAGPSLAFAILLAALTVAGCAVTDTRPSAISGEQARCQDSRGSGVWVAAAGACLRGGGGM